MRAESGDVDAQTGSREDDFDTRRGVRVRALRRERRLTQQALADMAGVALRTIRKWEDGRAITHANVLALAQALGTTAEYIREGRLADPAPSSDMASTLLRVERLLLDHDAQVLTRAMRLERHLRSVSEVLEGLVLELRGIRQDQEARVLPQERGAPGRVGGSEPNGPGIVARLPLAAD
jgi:transcriptional regulator with XRE-family HTH domain